MRKEKWVKKELGEVLELNYGKGLPKRKRKEGKYPVYGSSGVIDFHKEPLVDGPGIIVGRKGSVGEVYFSEKDFYPIDTVYYIENKKDVYNTLFIYYMLKSSKSLKESNDAAVPGLNRNYAHTRLFHIPPLSTQRKISTILFDYDELIENNTQRIELLEEIAQLIYREWFVSFMFPGHEDVEMVYNEELDKEIPERWDVEKVNDIIKKRIRTNGKVKKSDYLEKGKVPCVDQSEDYIGGYTNNENVKFDKYLPMVVFGDHTRRVKYVDFPFACGADGTKLIYSLNNEFSSEFLYFTLKNVDLKDHSYSRHFKFLKDKLVIIPEDEILNRFDEIVKPIMKEINILRDLNQNLRETRDMLLPRLVTGHIDVSDLDIEISDSVVEAEA